MSTLGELVRMRGARSGPRVGSAILGISSAYDVIRVLAACLLLTAAILTPIQLATERIVATSVLTTRPFLIATALVNLVFGLWLLCGLAPRWTRLGTILWFGVLACVSLTNALVIRSETCGCFGAARIPPGPVALLDAAIVLALCLCYDRASIRPPRWAVMRLVLFLVAAFAGDGLTTVVIARYSPATQRDFVLPPQLYDGHSYQPAEYDLPIVNTTDNVVRFDDKIVASCGCTKTKLAEQVLEPGASTTLHLAIDQRGIVGIRTAHLTLTDDTQRRWEYTVRAPAYPRFAFRERDFFVVPLSTGEKAVRDTVLDTYALPGEEPAKLLRLRSDSSFVVATIGEDTIETLREGVTRQRTPITISIEAPATADHYVTTLTAECDGVAAGSKSATITVNWSVKSVYRVLPERLFLGDLRQHRRLTKTVTVERLDGQPLSIAAVSAEHPAIQCSLAPQVPGEPGEPLAVTVDIKLDEVQMPLWTRVIVTTDYDRQRHVVIPVALIR